MRWYVLLVGVFLAGCGEVSMTLPGTPPREVPPALTANGVSGSLTSWCWQNACADAVVELSAATRYPDVGFPVTFQTEVPLSRISVRAVERGSRGLALPVEGTDHGAPVGGEPLIVSAIPPGDWAVLEVDVGFLAGGSASYVWELPEGRASP
jgi:hypothetical protein